MKDMSVSKSANESLSKSVKYLSVSKSVNESLSKCVNDFSVSNNNVYQNDEFENYFFRVI